MDSIDWAGLPDLILDLIFHKLSSISDCLRFRAVCKSWFSFVSNNYYALGKRRNSSSVEELPLLMICTIGEKEFNNTSLYSPASKSKIVFDFTLPFPNTWRCCGSSHGWLAFQHESDLLIQLFNPFSSETINLPRLKYFAGKIIITKNPSTNPNKFEVAAMIKGWSRLNGLAIPKPGSHTWIITYYYILEATDFCDMIYYNERYYVVSYENTVLSIDNTTRKVKEIIRHSSIMNSSPFIKFYLIKTTTDGVLRVQISFPRDNKPSSVKISKFVASQSNTQGSMFEELDDLGDEALFLCDHCSMSVSGSKFSGCKGNSV